MRTSLFLILSASCRFAQPKPPALLMEALRQLPSVHVLEPSMVDLRGGFTTDDLKRDGFWRPWVVADLDRDGLPDVVAAVVKRTPAGTQYGVLAVHAQMPLRFHWVVRLDDMPISGVVVGGSFGPDTVEPLYCYRCDANPWFRWSGRSYELEFYAIGARVAVAPEENSNIANLYVLPSRDAKKLRPVKLCAKAKVLDFQGDSYETRWYFVELLLPKPVRGWLPVSSVVFEADCFAN